MTAVHDSPYDGCMNLLQSVASACRAPRLVPVESAHVNAAVVTLGAAGVQWIEGFAKAGLRVRVPTTTNVLTHERENSSEDPLQAALQDRLCAALSKIGCIMSFSCNPFAQGFLPRRDDVVAWSESATTPYLNSVIGARSNREGATALASALTGLTPFYGMLLDSGRQATIHFDLQVEASSRESIQLLARIIARRCQSGVPAISGLTSRMPEHLLAFGATLAALSNVAMFHLVGWTPEAPTLAAAIGKRRVKTIVVGQDDLDRESSLATSFAAAAAEVVVLGCPHTTLQQIGEIANLVHGKHIRRGCSLIVQTSRDTLLTADSAGFIDRLRLAGVTVTADTCVYVGSRRWPAGVRLLTDSAKMASLMAARGFQTSLAGTSEAVRAVLSEVTRGSVGRH